MKDWRLEKEWNWGDFSNSQKEKSRFQIIWPNLLFLPDKIAFFLLPIPREFASSFLLESQIVYLKNFLSADVHFLANNQSVSQSVLVFESVSNDVHFWPAEGCRRSGCIRSTASSRECYCRGNCTASGREAQEADDSQTHVQHAQTWCKRVPVHQKCHFLHHRIGRVVSCSLQTLQG